MNYSYDVIYFGQIRTFKKNINSHIEVIKNARSVIISTWEDEQIPNEIYSINNNLIVSKQKFSECFFEKIGNVELPRNILESEFGIKHYKAMLPKHYLLKKASEKYKNSVKHPAEFIILLRPDLYLYDKTIHKSLFKYDGLVNTKDSIAEVSDQFLIGKANTILRICDLYDSLNEDWDKLKFRKENIPRYINEGYLSWKCEEWNIKVYREDKFFEINRGRLHLYNVLFKFIPTLKNKNRLISLLKKLNIWRSY
ncbi:hypothetical protein M634_03120 [Vibrio parahaemolyticus O1:Kuk str. FDA_R31]|uniref:WfaF n=4 Tax=Vibrio parahaemolyticus TaxID=670 RepID=A0A5P4S6M5_VIBPH|nr:MULTISPECIES: hypothetical protein [Vibrio harveyi group]AGQ91932.1 hypothetical protein M634_03120 [Vibrio parahaemolyticus O1:Kuk str. FDA_R31]EGR0769663.1 hypothetical protein [Vibrio parahaemolyticus]EGR0839422.1 hypothetical protein [Vibrio parahaemolyticus]EIK4806898.1 hypothetical protein [Vibrio parahaemolyticus]EJB5287759.1 hypothetical protein [Vibrio parahaemolyticus]